MIAFDNSYVRLSPKFYRHVAPTPVVEPQVVKFNDKLARHLGFKSSETDFASLLDHWSGNRIFDGSQPIAMAYAAHQFGHFVPQLGDGRAILLGEIIDRDGARRDIQLKGAGPTPFSRSGDGRAALGPVIREYIVSEAMHALGIRTTRALAAVLTGETVARETALPGAVFTRVAASHIRIGTFQYFAARGDQDGIRELVDYVIERHYPELLSAENRALALLSGVIERQAHLIASWMGVGFIHGVMNTDNMTISGETIDYGPCAFLDSYEAGKVFSSIDRNGRYAYRNQPGIAQWNLARLAETLLPLIDPDPESAVKLATVALERFVPLYEKAWLTVMRRKIGLATARQEDAALINWLLEQMEAGETDFTQVFRFLSHAAVDEKGEADFVSLFGNQIDIAPWLNAWRDRLTLEPENSEGRGEYMRLANPARIARNHQVEQAIQAGMKGDFEPFHRLVAALENPFVDMTDYAFLQNPPRPEERVEKTFCGT